MDTKSPESKDLVLEVSVRLHIKHLKHKKSWIITLVIALVHLGLNFLIKHH